MCSSSKFEMDLHYENAQFKTKKVLEECLNKYDLSEIFFCFNGGKDCSVLLSITLDLLKKGNYDPNSLLIVYIKSENPFPELEQFIGDITERFKLNMKVVSGAIKTVLQTMLESHPEFKACLMGTRRTDPFCDKLNYFQMTDDNWPQIMRVSPILDWSYHEIWSYLLDKKVPYCSLYDAGYTSLGNTKNTIPNPHLITTHENGTTSYLPAYLLKNGALERDGRN